MSKTEYFVDLIATKLNENRNNLLNQWNNPVGTNTRHFYLDELLPPDDCLEIFNSFPVDANGFIKLKSFREKKKTSVNLENFPTILSDITYAFQDKRIVDLVSDITDFKNIEPDPNLYAGGLSMMFENDYLNPHLDNSHDGERKKYRRLNLLYYVTPNWLRENGGNFELWDSLRLNPKTIVAHTNRLVVMETNKKSWHSVSRVLVDTPRCCVSNYYFSEESQDNSSYYHVTSFSGRPEQKIKRIFGFLDNATRNLAARVFGVGRGKSRKLKK